MKFNVWFTISGPVAVMEVPNTEQPVESAHIASLLARLSTNLPFPDDNTFGLKLKGVRIEECKE